MNITGFENIAQYLTHPLVLVGFGLMLAYGLVRQLMKSGLLPQVNQKDGSLIIRLFLRYGFWIILALLLAGIGLSAWNSYIEKEQAEVQQVNIEELAEKVAEKMLAKMSPSEPDKKDTKKAVIEAVTALPKIDDAPTKEINAALQELEQGQTTKAKSIFTEVLQTKEAEGKKVNKEAAAVARHLGALAYINNPQEAIVAYQKVVQVDPDNADGWNRLGNLFYRTGEFAQAEEAFRKTLALAEAHQDKEKQVVALSNLGSVYKTRGDSDKAEEMYSKAKKMGRKDDIEAKDYEMLTKISPSELDREDTKKAVIEAITALPKIDAPTKEINAALQELEQGQTTKAKFIFTEVLQIKEAEGNKVNKEAAAVARHLGALAYLNNPQEAIMAYQKAVQLDQDNTVSWNQLGNLLRRTGQFVQAEKAFRKVLSLAEAHQDKEKQAVAFGNLGLVYKTLGDLDKAEEMYSKAKALGSKDGIEAAREIIHLKALKLTKAALENKQDKYTWEANYHNLGNLYNLLGGLYYRRRDLDKAEEMYRKSLKVNQVLSGQEVLVSRDSGTPSIYGSLGNVYLARRDLGKAEEMYRKSLELNKALGSKQGMAGNYACLGSVYHTSGNLDKAEEMYRKGLEFNKDLGRKNGMATLYASLGFVYKKRGNMEQAEELWKKSLRLYQDMGAMQRPSAKNVQQALAELAEQRSTK